jgi:hypothetical protein
MDDKISIFSACDVTEFGTKNKNKVYLPSLMMNVPDHLYV